jgi:hypothetical protein
MMADDEKPDEKHEEVTYMDDIVPRLLILRILAWTVIISVVLCVIAYLLLKLREHQLRPSGRFPEQYLGPPHMVANVRETPFELPQPVPGLVERQRVLLRSYGWVDRAHGVVRIPVNRAVDLMLRQAQAKPAVQP